MKYIVLLILLTCSTGFGVCASQQFTEGEQRPVYYYELYSWQTTPGSGWNFSVFYNTDRNKTVKEVFDKKVVLSGVDQLKLKIVDMPEGSHIIWFDRLTINGAKARGSERLQYPPQELVQEIRRYAQTRNIQVLGPPLTAQ
jgi:hypothetical protein